jgi:hypothetical protein
MTILSALLFLPVFQEDTFPVPVQLPLLVKQALLPLQLLLALLPQLELQT